MRQKRVLLVDDDENQVSTFRSVLEEGGYSVETATTGEQALDIAEKTSFNLAIMDVVLPDMRGDEVAGRLRKRGDKTDLILITGHPSFQDCIDALDLGIHNILLKPIKAEELLRVAREALSDTQL